MNSIHLGQRIKDFLEKQENGLAGAVLKLEYTQSALYSIFRKEDVNTSIIRAISESYDVPMTYFFDTEKSKNYPQALEPEVTYNNSRIALLEAEKRGLEKENELLREMVEILKKG